MRYSLWLLAFICLIGADAFASRTGLESEGLAKVDLKVKDIILEKENFSKKVKNLPEGYEGGMDCRCTTEVRAPEILEFPSSGIGTINKALMSYAAARKIQDKSDYDNCVSSELSYTVPASNMRFVSIRYTGNISCGAYPVQTSEGLTFDSQTGQRINWGEIVDTSKLDKIAASCSAQYTKMINSPSEDPNVPDASGLEVPDEMFSLKDKDLNQAFVITNDKKIVLLMDEKFWPHAAGAIDCVVPKEAIRPAFYDLYK